MDGLIAYALAKKYTDEHGGGSGSDSTHTGQGAPTSSIVAKVGDLYRDTTNDKLYQCSNYISPSGITDLTGITFTFHDNMHNDLASLYGTSGSQYGYAINFTSNDKTCNNFVVIYNNYLGDYRFMYSYSGGFVQPYYESDGYWRNPEYKSITVIGGNDSTNATLINTLFTVADVSSIGSTWVEVVAKDIRVPNVTSVDEGKVLTVNSSGVIVADNVPTELPVVTIADEGKILAVDELGNWNKETPPPVGAYSVRGSGVPTSSIFANVGDFYCDTVTNKLYQCSQYNSPTTLLNKTVSFNTPLNFSDVTEDAEYNIVFTYGTNNSNGIKLTTEGKMYYKNSGTGNYTQVYYNGSWGNIYARELSITGGNDVENQSLLNFIQHNGSVSGTGSTWIEVKASDDRVPNAPITDGNYVLKCSVSDGTPTYTWVEET